MSLDKWFVCPTCGQAWQVTLNHKDFCNRCGTPEKKLRIELRELGRLNAEATENYHRVDGLKPRTELPPPNETENIKRA
jgi:hypothetical protein